MIEIDDSLVLEVFSELTGKELEKVFKNTLRKAGNILVRATRTELKGVVKNSNKKSKKYGTTLASGVKCKLIKEDGTNVAKVHIMGDFRLKFFEKGTKQRRTKGHRITGYMDAHHLKRSGRGGNRGSIEGEFFFKKAKSSTENTIFTTMNQMLRQSIAKVLSKRKK